MTVGTESFLRLGGEQRQIQRYPKVLNGNSSERETNVLMYGDFDEVLTVNKLWFTHSTALSSEPLIDQRAVHTSHNLGHWFMFAWYGS